MAFTPNKHQKKDTIEEKESVEIFVSQGGNTLMKDKVEEGRGEERGRQGRGDKWMREHGEEMREKMVVEEKEAIENPITLDWEYIWSSAKQNQTTRSTQRRVHLCQTSRSSPPAQIPLCRSLEE